mmetsp:Transcript_17236/g.53587  ORF Transcript_17236/g.53587 Transcript_17236/m.53587 type:complete len:466 (-) Transcript_17236:97-1494(-)
MVVAIVFVRHDRDNTNVTVADTLQSRIETLAAIELGELIGQASTQTLVLHDMARVLKAPEIKLAIDLNTTRVASRLMLLNSVVRMERPLATHMSQFDQVKDTCPQLSDEQRQTARGFEAVLNQTKHLTTLAQKEKMCVGPHVPLVLLKLEAALKSNQLAIIKRDKVSAGSSVEHAREMCDVADMTPLGKECLKRALVEFQRRFCGKDIEEPVSDARITITPREQLATVLDVRTKGCSHFSVSERKAARALLINEMIKFEKQVDRFNAEAAAAAAAPLPAAAAFPAAASVPLTPTRGAPHALESSWTPLAQAQLSDEQTNHAALEHALRERVTTQADAWLRTQINLAVEFPGCEISRRPDVVDDLVGLPLGRFYRGKLLNNGTIDKHPTFGYIPLMASRSWGQVGSLMAESFCERMLSCANTVLTDGNSLLGHEELERLVILRMNKRFMCYMRRTYPEVGKSIVIS